MCFDDFIVILGHIPGGRNKVDGMVRDHVSDKAIDNTIPHVKRTVNIHIAIPDIVGGIETVLTM